jgi:hypothetical protein
MVFLVDGVLDGSRFVEWPDAGHFGPFEMPDRLADVIRDVDDDISNTDI